MLESWCRCRGNGRRDGTLVLQTKSEGAEVKVLRTLVSSTLMLATLPVAAQQIALAPGPAGCDGDEPDSIQISWDAPCESGSWILEPGEGCRIADWHPDPHDKADWSGTCRSAVREGPGVAQWTEHGEAIDRFEGTYRNGRREGIGRYTWSAGDRFEGTYVNDLPHGLGTVTVAGRTLSGIWQEGCLKVGDNLVAIGVPRRTCDEAPEYSGDVATLPSP